MNGRCSACGGSLIPDAPEMIFESGFRTYIQIAHCIACARYFDANTLVERTPSADFLLDRGETTPAINLGAFRGTL